MDNLRRHSLYAGQRGVGVAWYDEDADRHGTPAWLTGPQRRRLRHKRAAHAHEPGQRCPLCRPPGKAPGPAPFRPAPRVRL